MEDDAFRKIGVELSQWLGLDVRLTRIDEAAFSGLDSWTQRSHISIGWDWRGLRDRYAGLPAVELAIWSEKILCGLAVGPLDNAGGFAAIEYLEANPTSHPLQGTILTLAAAVLDFYAAAHGCGEIRFLKPVKELSEHSVWRDLDFAFVKGPRGNYFQRPSPLTGGRRRRPNP